MEQICPIWRTGAGVLRHSLLNDYLVNSDRAGGKFQISRNLCEDHFCKPKPGMRVALSTYILIENLSERIPIITNENFQQCLKDGKANSTERYNLVLKVIKYQINDQLSSEPFRLREISDKLMNAVGSQNSIIADIFLFLDAAQTDGRIQISDETRIGRTRIDCQIELTLNGHLYLESLGQSLNDNPQIFVAMWFGGEMKRVYDEAIKPAIEAAGYQAMRIDNLEHNGKVDDAIIAEIRKSKALIVDLTCGIFGENDTQTGVPRGGVYYEAGFAHGLGLPVIWTVDKEIAEIPNVVHVDTRQFNQIRWDHNNLAELKEKLTKRIEATLGVGPLYKIRS